MQAYFFLLCAFILRAGAVQRNTQARTAKALSGVTQQWKLFICGAVQSLFAYASQEKKKYGAFHLGKMLFGDHLTY